MVEDPIKEKFKKIAVLKHMFGPADLASDPGLALEIKEDVREECERLFGDVSAITLFDSDPQGVVTVRFGSEVAALACVAKNDGRFFDGRRIAASIYDGRERFGADSDDLAGDEEEEKARLSRYGDWLVSQGS